MLKIIASIIIFSSFSLIGFYYAYREIYRKNDLLEMKRAILLLISEIKFLSSINEAVMNIEKDIDSAIKDIFVEFRQNIIKKRGEGLSVLWEDAVKIGSKKTYLLKQDKEKICLVGKVIGLVDKSFSLEGLNIVINYIDMTVKEIDKEKNKNMKMYQSLGIFSGLILIILLV